METSTTSANATIDYLTISINEWYGHTTYSYGNAKVINGTPEPATSCTARKTGDITFGNILEKDVNGAKAGTSVVLECTGDSTVKVRFVNMYGEGAATLRSDLKGNLFVGGWNGKQGFNFQVKKGIPEIAAPNVVLSPVGSVAPGTFQGQAVVKVDVE
ncbi:hypothetical protein V6X42_23950 [Serratia marcescens]|uniref:MrpH family fimbial adhesin n=1 Tax=Serratia marcescens TaxID=615 RepID=UPI002FE6B7D5